MEIPRFNITVPPDMRSINQIIIHCSATPEGRDVTVDQIRRMHIQDNHWNDIGYHYVIYRDGSIHPGRPLAKEGAHTKNHNAHSIGICYIGGMDSEYKKAKDTRTPQQKEALVQLVKQLFELFGPLQVNRPQRIRGQSLPQFQRQGLGETEPHHRRSQAQYPFLRAEERVQLVGKAHRAHHQTLLQEDRETGRGTPQSASHPPQPYPCGHHTPRRELRRA